jgi:dienelactone hydrolase
MTGPLLLAAILAALLAQAPQPGPFVGWFRLADGSDMPVWVRLDGDRHAAFSFPAQRAYDVSADTAAVDGNRVTFSRKNENGVAIRFALTAEGDLLSGPVVQDGKKLGDARLRRAEFMPQRGDGFADLAGCYRSSDGGTLRISAWGWGELRCLDLGTGAERTLFVDESDDLCAGSSLYSLARIERSFHVSRDGGITLTEGDRKYRKIELLERNLQTKSGEKTLACTLLWPESRRPLPVAVILGGSDVQTRGEVRWEAEILNALGIAALSFDLSGRGKSTGKPVIPFAESASDVSAVVALARAQSECDPRRVGLIGTSRGGWLAPLAASLDARVGFVVMLSGPAVSPQVQLTSFRLDSMRATGHDGADLAEARSYLELMWQCDQSQSDWDRYAAKRKEVEGKGWLPLLQGPASQDSEEYRWLTLNNRYDPVPALEHLSCPVLALFGAEDRIVDPRENAGRLASCLAGHTKDWTVKVLPRASHGLNLVDAAAPQRARPIEDEEGFAPDAWTTVGRWILAK